MLIFHCGYPLKMYIVQSVVLPQKKKKNISKKSFKAQYCHHIHVQVCKLLTETVHNENQKWLCHQQGTVVLTEALAAVTVPPFLNTGGSFPNCSRVVCGRGCSSWVITTFPLLALTSIGAISVLK